MEAREDQGGSRCLFGLNSLSVIHYTIQYREDKKRDGLGKKSQASRTKHRGFVKTKSDNCLGPGWHTYHHLLCLYSWQTSPINQSTAEARCKLEILVNTVIQ